MFGWLKKHHEEPDYKKSEEVFISLTFRDREYKSGLSTMCTIKTNKSSYFGTPFLGWIKDDHGSICKHTSDLLQLKSSWMYLLISHGYGTIEGCAERGDCLIEEESNE